MSGRFLAEWLLLAFTWRTVTCSDCDRILSKLVTFENETLRSFTQRTDGSPSSCHWLISTPRTVAIRALKGSGQDLDMVLKFEYSYGVHLKIVPSIPMENIDCKRESFEIFDGNNPLSRSLGRWCAAEKIIVESSGPSLYLLYRATYSSNPMSFTLKYRRYIIYKRMLGWYRYTAVFLLVFLGVPLLYLMRRNRRKLKSFMNNQQF